MLLYGVFLGNRHGSVLNVPQTGRWGGIRLNDGVLKTARSLDFMFTFFPRITFDLLSPSVFIITLYTPVIGGHLFVCSLCS